MLDKLKKWTTTVSADAELFGLPFTPSLQWFHALQLPGMHKKGITCLAGRMVSDTIAIFSSTSSDGIVVIWEMAIEPTTGGKIASLWIANITARSLIFCHDGLNYSNSNSFLLYDFDGSG